MRFSDQENDSEGEEKDYCAHSAGVLPTDSTDRKMNKKLDALLTGCPILCKVE